MGYYQRKNSKTWVEVRIFCAWMLIIIAICAAGHFLIEGPSLSDKMGKMDSVIAEAENRARQSLR